MQRWGLILVALAIATAAAVWSWSNWTNARQSLVTAAVWRDETGVLSDQLLALQSQRANLDFVVPADAAQSVYDQIRAAQQKAGVSFAVQPFQPLPVKDIPGFATGEFRSLKFTATMRQFAELVQNLETAGPFWLHLSKIRIDPGPQVQQGQPEQLNFEIDMQCIVYSGADS